MAITVDTVVAVAMDLVAKTVDLAGIVVDLPAITVDLAAIAVDLAGIAVDLPAIAVDLAAIAVDLAGIAVELAAITVDLVAIEVDLATIPPPHTHTGDSLPLSPPTSLDLPALFDPNGKDIDAVLKEVDARMLVDTPPLDLNWDLLCDSNTFKVSLCSDNYLLKNW